MRREYYVQCSPFAVQSTPTGRVHTYPGMDCGSEQLGSGFHYLMNEQARSLAALHELQNEVGALLEFRDLVIETFPHLRSKMASQPGSPGALSSSITTPNSSGPGMSHIPVPTRREWEPGIRVKRKLGNKDQETSASSLTSSRSRSNSQGSKYQATQSMSGVVNANGSATSSAGSSAVQDSGFGTESKEHYSASSSASQRGSGVSAEDELWNLLDVIHRKGSRLRQEVEHLQLRLQDKDNNVLERACDRERIRARSLGSVPSDDIMKDQQRLLPSHSRARLSRSVEKCFTDLDDEYSDRIELYDESRDSRDSTDYRTQRLLELGREEVRGLRKERDLLLDRLAEMEAEMLASRARASHLKNEVGALSSAKRELEEQLQCTLSQKNELNSRIHDLHLQFVKNTVASSNGSLGKPLVVPSPKRTVAPSQFISSQALRPTETSCFTPVLPSHLSSEEKLQRLAHQQSISNCSSAESSHSKMFQLPDKTVNVFAASENGSYSDSATQQSQSEFLGRNAKLGTLDGIVSSPCEISSYMKGISPDSDKIAAVLKETNHVELQRHLLTSMAENKALRLTSASEQRLREGLAQQLDSVREENDDLKFQLEERSIELEGTRARVRVLEKMHHLNYRAESPSQSRSNGQNQIPIGMGDEPSNQQHSSSTESAHDIDGQRAPTTTPTTTPANTPSIPHKAPLSPRRRPSKIPLVKSYCAPKPPGSRSSHEGASNSNSTSISSTGRDTLKKRKESKTAGSSPASRGCSTPEGTTLSWRNRRDSSPSLGPSGRSRDSLSSGGVGRSSSTSAPHGSRESLGGPRSRSTPAKTDGNHSKNPSLASASSLSRRDVAKSRDSIHSSPGGRKIHTSQLRRNSVNSSLSRTTMGETDQSKARTTRLFSWGNWWKIGILDSPS